MVMEVIEVKYLGQEAGAVSFDTETGRSAFEYSKAFQKNGVELSPLHMPLGNRIYTFPALDYDTFKGLPGLLADSLPDDFGNAVLNAWVARQGKLPGSITPLQRLQYIGKRGMGALEFTPATKIKTLNAAQDVALAELVHIAQDVLDHRNQFEVELDTKGRDDRDAMLALLSVGTSAGGARPKAVLAFNHDFTAVRSGQTDAPDGFTHYLLKFDGVTEHSKGSQTFGDPLGFCAMEYVYYQLASDCGITMMPCRLLTEGKRRHFLTQRFDRIGSRKRHVQTLNGLAHVSYKQVGMFSYEEVFSVLRQLGAPPEDAEELFRRMVFNVIARNHDDHTKNFAFQLDEDSGQWRLAPAYDIAFSYKPGSRWVDVHAMTLNGKRDGFTREDFYAFSQVSRLFSKTKVDAVINHTREVMASWRARAQAEEVPSSLIDFVGSNLRLAI